MSFTYKIISFALPSAEERQVKRAVNWKLELELERHGTRWVLAVLDLKQVPNTSVFQITSNSWVYAPNAPGDPDSYTEFSVVGGWVKKCGPNQYDRGMIELGEGLPSSVATIPGVVPVPKAQSVGRGWTYVGPGKKT